MKSSALKNLLFATTLASLSFTSCDKTLYEGEKDPQNKKTFENMSIPDNFNWKMTRNITCELTSPNTTFIEIFFDRECNTATQIASLQLSAAQTEKIELSLPAYADTLYVRYENNSGKTRIASLPIQNNVARFAFPADTRKNVDTRSVVRWEEYIPAKDWGTVMFEDQWPEFGDFDFNDIAFNYKIQLYMSANNKAEAMLIGIRINAVGGNIPYNLYLQLDKVKRTDIEILEPYLDNKNGGNLDIQLLDGAPSQPAIIAFQNIRENLVRKSGNHFFNTEKGYEIPSDQLITLICYIEFTESQNKEAKLKADYFNFFIGYDDDNTFKEIHTPDFKPTNMGEAAYRAMKDKHGLRDYYHGKNNLVWGINVPTAIPHAYEKIDFTKAYPNFIRWAESGGKTHTDWYTNAEGNRVSEYLCRQR